MTTKRKVSWSYQPPTPKQVEAYKLTPEAHPKTRMRAARRLALLARPETDRYPYHHCDPQLRREMQAVQDGRCACCGCFSTLLVVNHCRRTGYIRALVCRLCQAAIRRFESARPKLAKNLDRLASWDGEPDEGRKVFDRVRKYLLSYQKPAG